MTAGSVAVTIQYDADGNRVAKTVAGVTTRYLVDDLNPTGYAQVAEEVTGTTASRTYTYGLQRISQNQQISNAWTPSFYGYDGGGTVRLLTDISGTVTDTYDYDAWGNEVNTTGSTPNSYLYRGEQFDADLSLYYLRARYINPGTGRFVSQDTFQGITTDPITLHKYLYANSNPVNMSDPTGRAAGVVTAELEPIYAPVGGGLGTAGSVAAGGTIMPLTGAMVAAAALEIDCMWELAGSWLELAAQHASGINFNGVLSMGPPGRWMRLVCSVKEGKGWNRCGPGYHDHHMIPQAVGPIVDPIISPLSIDDDWNIWCCPPGAHLDGLHGGGGPGGDWNNAWRQCLGKRPGPSQVWGCFTVIKGMFSDILKKCKPLVSGQAGGPRSGGMQAQ